MKPWRFFVIPLLSVMAFIFDESAYALPEGAIMQFQHEHPVVSVSFSKDGKTLATATGWGDGDKTITLWNAQTGEALSRHRLPGETVRGPRRGWLGSFAAFSPDGKTVALVGEVPPETHVVLLWDATRGTVLRRLEGHDGDIQAVSFSPDGRTVAAGGLPKGFELPICLTLWDAQTGERLRTLEAHRQHGSGVDSISFSPDGRTLASGSFAGQPTDPSVILWEVQTGKLLHRLEGSPPVAFSPDGKTVATGGGALPHHNTVLLWDVQTGQVLRRLESHNGHVSSIAFSPDGRTVASGGFIDPIIDLWDATTGQVLHRFQGHKGFGGDLPEGAVTSLSFSPDGVTLASGSWDGTVLIWAVQKDSVSVFPKGKRPTTLGELKRTALWQNYPNPFNPETWIPFQLVKPSDVTLRIYTSEGKLVRTLPLGQKAAGTYLDPSHAAHWDGTDEAFERVSSGIYFYQLQAGDFSQIRKLAVVK